MALTNFSLPFGALAHSTAPWGATGSTLHPIHQQLAANTNNLLYSPADHQQQQGDSGPPPPGSDFYKNNPYAPPQQTATSYQYNSNNNNSNGRRKNTYLPPIAPPGARNTQQFHNQQQHQHQFQHHQQQQFSHINTHQQQHVTQSIDSNINNNNNNNIYETAIPSSLATLANSPSNTNTRTYGEGTYTRFPQATLINNNNNSNNGHNINKDLQQPQQQSQYYNSFSSTSHQEQQTKHLTTAAASSAINPSASQTFPNYGVPNSQVETPAPIYGAAGAAAGNKAENSGLPSPTDSSSNDPFPERPPGFTRVQAGQGSKTRVHAVLDYDLEEGEEEDEDYSEDHGNAANKDEYSKTIPATPIQGPIYLKNGTVPVVPLFHYPTFNNGTYVQMPIWWTALSVALGIDVRGDVIKGVPCIKRNHQLYCPTAGNSYPIDKIERFIDDNKALMRRLYGDFEMDMSAGGGPRQQTKKRKRRFIDEPDIFLPPGTFPNFVPDDKINSHAEEHGESYFGELRNKRQTNRSNRNGKQTQNASNVGSSTGRVDACESKTEIVTPYWASNSGGKIRAIVNTQHFEQAIHQEICSKSQTSRCQGDCGCEQKYKWHRLLAYDPDNDCKGIFMDWFLFPSCCTCRCNP